MAKQNGDKPFADKQLTRSVMKSANLFWDAGRGVYSRAGSESSRLVGGLLNIGGRIDREAKSRVFEVRNNATEAWDRIESAFVHRVARALNALQIPTARDVHELNDRVEALQKAIVALERRVAASATPKPGVAKPRRAGAGRPRKEAPAAVKKKTTTRARKKAGS